MQKALQAFEVNDSKSELQLSNNNKEETANDPNGDLQSGTANGDKSTDGSNPGQWRSAHELESIVIFDLCALSEIATSKSAILRVRVLPLFVTCKHRWNSFCKTSQNLSVSAVTLLVLNLKY